MLKSLFKPSGIIDLVLKGLFFKCTSRSIGIITNLLEMRWVPCTDRVSRDYRFDLFGYSDNNSRVGNEKKDIREKSAKWASSPKYKTCIIACPCSESVIQAAVQMHVLNGGKTALSYIPVGVETIWNCNRQFSPLINVFRFFFYNILVN